ncbi:hypothetical protein ACFV9C_35465 [Kribbella sp. NPDC059898]|uniref:hypothetical protein n=1 Tax=Kribbella sp. NPDC059898 TaxID=3346995 RepID=UPI00365CCA86
MVKLGLVLAAGYAGYKVAYHSEDGRHYGRTGERTIRTTLSLLIASLAGGLTYAVLLQH